MPIFIPKFCPTFDTSHTPRQLQPKGSGGAGDTKGELCYETSSKYEIRVVRQNNPPGYTSEMLTGLDKTGLYTNTWAAQLGVYNGQLDSRSH